MILLGIQGTITKDQQIRALHVYMDELDIPMAKPLFMNLYGGKMEENHFSLGIRMWSVPEKLT